MFYLLKSISLYQQLKVKALSLPLEFIPSSSLAAFPPSFLIALWLKLRFYNLGKPWQANWTCQKQTLISLQFILCQSWRFSFMSIALWLLHTCISALQYKTQFDREEAQNDLLACGCLGWWLANKCGRNSCITNVGCIRVTNCVAYKKEINPTVKFKPCPYLLDKTCSNGKITFSCWISVKTSSTAWLHKAI